MDQEQQIQIYHKIATFKRRLDAFYTNFNSSFKDYHTLQTESDFKNWLTLMNAILQSFHYNVREVIDVLKEKEYGKF